MAIEIDEEEAMEPWNEGFVANATVASNFPRSLTGLGERRGCGGGGGGGGRLRGHCRVTDLLLPPAVCERFDPLTSMARWMLIDVVTLD